MKNDHKKTKPKLTPEKSRQITKAKTETKKKNTLIFQNTKFQNICLFLAIILGIVILWRIDLHQKAAHIAKLPEVNRQLEGYYSELVKAHLPSGVAVEKVKSYCVGTANTSWGGYSETYCVIRFKVNLPSDQAGQILSGHGWSDDNGSPGTYLRSQELMMKVDKNPKLDGIVNYGDLEPWSEITLSNCKRGNYVTNELPDWDYIECAWVYNTYIEELDTISND